MGASGFFMINDPGFGGAVQVVSRLITSNGGSTGSNVRYMDVLSNGDSVPSTIISTTASTARRLGNFGGVAFSSELQRAVVFHNSGGGRNDLVSYSDNLGVTWIAGTFSSRQARGGLYVAPWSRWIGFGLTGSGTPFTGQFFNSVDGRSFTLQQTLASTNIYCSFGAYSPSLNIAVAANAGTATKNCCYWSTDATTWYAGTFSGTSFNPGECPVIYQDYFNTFLVGRGGNSISNYFAISTDGKNWDPITATGISTAPTGWSPLAMAHNPITGRTIIGKFSGNNTTNLIAYSDNGGYNWSEVTLSLIHI